MFQTVRKDSDKKIDADQFNELLRKVDQLYRALGSNTYVSSKCIATRSMNLGGGSADISSVKWAKAKAALTDNSKLSVALLNNVGDTEVGDPFDVWVFWDRSTSFTASQYKMPDFTSIADGKKVLVCQDQHGAWYLCPGQVIKCETVSVLTSFQVADNKVSWKKTTITCIDNGTEDASWTDHTGTTCA